MNWQLEWSDGSLEHYVLPVLGSWELEQIRYGMRDAIEDFFEELEYLQEYGETCELCGEFRHCNTHIGETVTPTDRGPMREECEKLLCEECYDRLTGTH